MEYPLCPRRNRQSARRRCCESLRAATLGYVKHSTRVSRAHAIPGTLRSPQKRFLSRLSDDDDDDSDDADFGDAELAFFSEPAPLLPPLLLSRNAARASNSARLVS